jgi:hypothetical protein
MKKYINLKHKFKCIISRVKYKQILTNFNILNIHFQNNSNLMFS